MAKKLVTNKAITTANTGTQFLSKLKRLDEIKINPYLSAAFDKNEKILAAIVKSMTAEGYDDTEPVVLWKETGEIVDGHTRYEAAVKAGLYEIPVAEKSFKSIEEARAYTEHRQFDRRNLTQAEIYERAVHLENAAEKTGQGRTSEKLAEELGVSASTIQHARTVEKKASDEVKQKLKNNEMTINQAYQTVRKKNTPVQKDISEIESDPIEDENTEVFSIDLEDTGVLLSEAEENGETFSDDYKHGFLDGFRKGMNILKQNKDKQTEVAKYLKKQDFNLLIKSCE